MLSLKVWGNPWIVLLYTASVWGCNAVAEKLAVSQISPMCLVFFKMGIGLFNTRFFLSKNQYMNIPLPYFRLGRNYFGWVLRDLLALVLYFI